MVQAIAAWVGVAVGLGLLLVMALGPIIVEADSWWFERRHARRRRRARAVRAAETELPPTPAPV